MCNIVKTTITIETSDKTYVITEDSLHTICNLIKQLLNNAFETFQQIVEQITITLNNVADKISQFIHKLSDNLELLDNLPSRQKEFNFCYYKTYGLKRTLLPCKAYNYIQDKRIKNMPYTRRY